MDWYPGHKMEKKNLFVVCFVGMFLLLILSGVTAELITGDNSSANLSISYSNGTFYHTSGLISKCGVVWSGKEFNYDDHYEIKRVGKSISFGPKINFTSSPLTSNIVSGLEKVYCDVTLPIGAEVVMNSTCDDFECISDYTLDFRRKKSSINWYFAQTDKYEYYKFSTWLDKLPVNNHSVEKLDDIVVEEVCDEFGCYNITQQRFHVEVFNFDKSFILGELSKDGYYVFDADPTVEESSFTTAFAFDSGNTNITGGNAQLNATGLTDNTGWFLATKELIDYSPQNTSGLVGHWIQDFTDARDESGNGNNGTFNGGLASCNNKGSNGYDYSCDFDGVDDYVSVPDNDDFSFTNGTNDTAFSVSSWWYMNDATKFRAVGKFTTTTESEWGIYTGTSDRIQFALIDDNSSSDNVVAWCLPALTSYENEWINIVGTYDPSIAVGFNGMKVYLNGEELTCEISETGTYVGMHNSNDDVTIGEIVGTYAEGKISNVQIYNRSFSAQQVWDNYRGSRDNFYVHNASWVFQDKDAVLTLNLDKDSPTQKDSSGFGNDGTVVNATFNSSGYFNGAYEFDGVDSTAITLPNLGISGSQSRTVEFWIKPETENRLTAPFFSGGSGTRKIFEVALDVNADNDIYIATSGADVKTGGGVINENQWNHIVVTYNGGNINTTNLLIYHDGILQNTTFSGTQGLANTSDTNYAIGKDTLTAGRVVNGTIDEVNIYPRALSAAEVLAHNNSNSPDDFLINNTNTTLQVRVTNESYEGAVSSNTSMALWLDLNQNSSTVTDKSGQGNDGTVTGATFKNVTGNLYFNDGYYEFDGNSDYITVPSSTDWAFGTDDFAVEVWFNTYEIESGPFVYQNNMIGTYHDSVAGANRWLVNLRSGLFRLYCDGVVGSIIASTAVGTNEWHHGVVTRKDGVGYLYLDGVLDKTNALTCNISAEDILDIGYSAEWTSSDRDWNGSIDEVHIYNRSLSADEVRNNYWRGNFSGVSWSSDFTNNTFSDLDSAVGSTQARFIQYNLTLNNELGDNSTTPTIESVVFNYNNVSGAGAAPTYSNIAHNNSEAGKSTLFSVLWNDSVALHPNGQYIFSTNNTGTWVNDSAVNFTATPSWANVTKTLNSTENLAIGYRWYATNNEGTWNDTGVQILVSDTTPPTYSNIAHNNTVLGRSTEFSVLWDNFQLHPNGQYIFSTNNTGVWVNDSAVNFTATPSWANVTKTLNSTVGISIGYIWYATDNQGNANDTGVQVLTTNDVPRYLRSWGNLLTNQFVATLNYSGSLWLLGDLDIGGIITFVNGETIDNIIDGWIRVDGNLNTTGIIIGRSVFGEMYQNASDITTINITTAGNYFVWNNSIVNNIQNITANTNGTFVIEQAGYYEIDFSVSVREGESQCIEAEVHKNSVPLAPQSEIRQTIPGFPEIFPSEITNVTGTLDSGTIEDGKVHDGRYMVFGENAGVYPNGQYQVKFIDREQQAMIVEVCGFYVGSAAHNNEFQCYNNNSGTWVRKGVYSNDDFPHNPGIPTCPRFYINGTLSDYYNIDNELFCRLDHVSSGSSGHKFWFDSMTLLRDKATTILTNNVIEYLDAGDVVDLRFTCPINIKEIEIINGNFNMKRLN
jgi:hypothetical protein